jgi:hypothetical protein
VNDTTEPDSADDGLPGTPLFAILRSIEREIGVEQLERVWVFPPRRMETGETGVVVAAAFAGPGDDRRRVFAAHYTAAADGTGARLSLEEYGTAPADRVGRVVEEVVERLKEGPAEAPYSARLDGDTSRWHTLLHRLAEQHLEEAQGHRRLRRPPFPPLPGVPPRDRGGGSPASSPV